jgi:hypothetical protein
VAVQPEDLLAFHYGFVPQGQPLTMTRLARAAGLRWPMEEEIGRQARTAPVPRTLAQQPVSDSHP